MMTSRLFAPVALLLVSSACFATRNDVRILQGDIFALRTQQARADSARMKQLADVAAAMTMSLGGVRDSIRDLGNRLTSFQGSTRQELYSLGQQLLQLGETVGQSQTVMRSFRADIEERNRQVMEQAVRTSVPAAAPGDSTKPPVAPVPLAEGPNVLYEQGRQMLLQNSWTAARDAFSQLISQHPTSDRIPLALYGIGESFDGEGNRMQGDSVFRLVADQYPTSDAAPRSLYKLGQSLLRQRKTGEARVVFQQIVRNYARSDEAQLASDWLTRNPG